MKQQGVYKVHLGGKSGFWHWDAQRLWLHIEVINLVPHRIGV